MYIVYSNLDIMLTIVVETFLDLVVLYIPICLNGSSLVLLYSVEVICVPGLMKEYLIGCPQVRFLLRVHHYYSLLRSLK